MKARGSAWPARCSASASLSRDTGSRPPSGRRGRPRCPAPPRRGPCPGRRSRAAATRAASPGWIGTRATSSSLIGPPWATRVRGGNLAQLLAVAGVGGDQIALGSHVLLGEPGHPFAHPRGQPASGQSRRGARAGRRRGSRPPPARARCRAGGRRRRIRGPRRLPRARCAHWSACSSWSTGSPSYGRPAIDRHA